MNNNFGDILGPIGVILTSVIAIVNFIFWIIVAWRAMRAHERIASTLEERMPR